MILSWVMSFLLLCSSLIIYLERLTVLRMMEVKTIESAQSRFMEAERAVLKCEENITHSLALAEDYCSFESVGKSIWLISSKEKPSIQIHVLVDEKAGSVTRLNWRQAFE